MRSTRAFFCALPSLVTISLSLAHSPDPDDVFMWWPITGMIRPPTSAQAQLIQPAHVLSAPEIDTDGFSFTPFAADIAVLNRRALERADLDITAISFFAWAGARARYQLTSFGSSFGEGYGPKIVSRHARTLSPDSVVAVPGVKTSAFLLLTLFAAGTPFRHVEMPFDQILDAVARGDRGITHGLLIHQSQLTYQDLGLHLLVDLGQWWCNSTSLPLPLGGNALRRDLDQRFAPGVTQRLVNVLDRSIRHALTHRERSIQYAMQFAPELSRSGAERYIDMYVSKLTMDCGSIGKSAIERLLSEAARLGLCPAISQVDLLRPAGLA